ncbi:hypothetical protein [Microbulbifer magnicolonia]|nr:hypothetical protein [Microbulbifer sp. GG15]
MKTVMAIVRKTIGTQPTRQSDSRECNYADNYYGDQVCLQRGEIK